MKLDIILLTVVANMYYRSEIPVNQINFMISLRIVSKFSLCLYAKFLNEKFGITVQVFENIKNCIGLINSG